MIAILAIFFAIELEVAGLERMVTWVVVSFVGFHVVTHTVLTVRDKLFIVIRYNLTTSRSTCAGQTTPPGNPAAP